jgi:hypothetical protein
VAASARTALHGVAEGGATWSLACCLSCGPAIRGANITAKRKGMPTESSCSCSLVRGPAPLQLKSCIHLLMCKAHEATNPNVSFRQHGALHSSLLVCYHRPHHVAVATAPCVAAHPGLEKTQRYTYLQMRRKELGPWNWARNVPGHFVCRVLTLLCRLSHEKSFVHFVCQCTNEITRSLKCHLEFAGDGEIKVSCPPRNRAPCEP